MPLPSIWDWQVPPQERKNYRAYFKNRFGGNLSLACHKIENLVMSLAQYIDYESISLYNSLTYYENIVL